MAAEFIHDDIVEHIVIRLDVKDLLHCKSVCKSWHSLITSSSFVKRHLNRSYNKDRCNNELGDRRIVLDHKTPRAYQLVGSSNGLVCIIYDNSNSEVEVEASRFEVLIGNPSTREVRQLELPLACERKLTCWGFGYDSSVNDYKVVVGVSKGRNQTCFQVLSLKSNVWKDIGEVKYTFFTEVGVLCNGALHWIATDETYKKSIISYDLSKDEFREVPQPDDARYERTSTSIKCLGVMKESLCIFRSYRSNLCLPYVWLMNNYNVKDSWELLARINDINRDNIYIVHRLISSNDKSFFHDDASWFLKTCSHLGLSRKLKYIKYAPIFVWSLVSPHVNQRPSNSKTSVKLIKGDPGPNARV